MVVISAEEARKLLKKLGISSDEMNISFVPKSASQSQTASTGNSPTSSLNGSDSTTPGIVSVDDSSEQSEIGVDLLKKAFAAQDRGDQEGAVAIFRELAASGNPDGQGYLGYAYDSGIGVTQDRSEAAKWYRLAAEQGHAEAQYMLAWMNEDGDGVPQDEDEAKRWYRLAAEQGHARAQFRLGRLLDRCEWRVGVISRGSQSIRCILGRNENASEREYVDSADTLKWYRLAAEQGHAEAQYMLGLMHDEGEGVPADKKKAEEWYRLAATQGHPGAQYQLDRRWHLP